MLATMDVAACSMLKMWQPGNAAKWSPSTNIEANEKRSQAPSTEH